MPGMFESKDGGKSWTPAILKWFSNGKILKKDSENPRIMDAIVRGEAGSLVPLRVALGEATSVNNPLDGKAIPMEGPDPAAMEAIRKMTGDEQATSFPLSAPAEVKPSVTVVTASGDSAMVEENRKLRAEMNQLREMFDALAKGVTVVPGAK